MCIRDRAFATFLLLSYVKLLNTTIDILLPVKAYNVYHKAVGVYVYYDASYIYFSKEHLPYAIMGIVFFLTFVLSPLILLLLYPTTCFQKCLSSCRLRSHILHTFVDTFQGYYKDGTEPGTRDCRWFAPIYFLGRIIVVYIVFGVSEGDVCYALTGICMIFLGAMIVVLQPYKSSKVNTYHTIMVLYLAVTCFLATTLDQATIKAQWIVNTVADLIGIMCLLPTLVAIAYVMYCLLCTRFMRFKAVWQMFPRFRNIIHKHGEKRLHSTVCKSYQSINT